jgi:hypothetical protein
MYSRRSNGRAGCWAIIAGLLLVFGGYYVWRGFMTFMASNGDINAPILTRTAEVSFQTATVNRILGTLDLHDLPTIPFTPTKACIEFKVKVVKARIRECPKETCNTIDLPVQGTSICVVGPAADDNNWYQIIVDPKDPIAEIGYMHKSVLAPANPTKTPMPPLKFPTVTPLPTQTQPKISIPPPSDTPSSADVPPTEAPTPSRTPLPVDDSA